MLTVREAARIGIDACIDMPMGKDWAGVCPCTPWKRNLLLR